MRRVLCVGYHGSMFLCGRSHVARLGAGMDDGREVAPDASPVLHTV